MKHPFLIVAAIPALVLATSCTPTWNHDSGPRTLSSSGIHLPASPGEDRTVRSLPVSCAIPAGWHWFERGDDLIMTRDGVFLQHILIERIHVSQTEQAVLGMFPFAAFSSKQWPVRTLKHMKERFTAGMAPDDAAELLLGSRRNDPAISGLEVLKVVTRTVAGRQAFRALFEFRLKSAEQGSVLDVSPLYRSAYCGFMEGDWFYGISYTAAARHYFDRDAATFEAFLDSIRLVER